jgi:hypothetical protein
MSEENQDKTENYRLRNHFEQRYYSMDNERQSFLPLWQDISDHVRPNAVRINTTIKYDKGRRADRCIIDPTATLASRTLRSGLMAGLTSPARPWFKLNTPNTDLNAFAPVKAWLYNVEVLLHEAFAKSNLYQILPLVYGDCGDFATSCMSCLEDDKTILRFSHFMPGQYFIAVNNHNRCDSMYRRFPMTVRQLVQMFGMENVSPTVKSMYDSQQYEMEIEVCQAIEPNDSRDRASFSNADKPFRSVWFEWGEDWGKFLRKSGFDEFPIMAPRWDLYDESCYGTSSPGIDCLGSNRALQLADKRETQAVDWYVRPHYLVDSSLRNQFKGMLPGGETYIDNLAASSHAGARPVREVNPSIKEIDLKIQRYQGFIKRCYFEDVMQTLIQGETSDRKTAREVEEYHAEKVLILGPVMERFNDELFDPLIERAFGILSRKGFFPRPPKELEGHDLKVEYTSILAQAQKLLGTTNIQAVYGFTAQLAQMDPKVVDKFNGDEAVDTFAAMHGINPNIIRGKEEVGKLRELRAKQQQAAQIAQMAKPMKEMAQAGKAMGETDGDNLKQMMSGMTGQ